MTELEQYKIAYATLVGHVDEVATKLMKAAAKVCPGDGSPIFLAALELIFALHEAENVFLDEEAEEK